MLGKLGLKLNKAIKSKFSRHDTKNSKGTKNRTSLNIDRAVFSKNDSWRDAIKIFSTYSEIFKFEYFTGGQYRYGTTFVNYIDSSENRLKLIDILRSLDKVLPSIRVVKQKSTEIVEVNNLIERLSNSNKSPAISTILFPAEPESPYIENPEKYDNAFFGLILKPWNYLLYYEGNSFYEPISNNARQSRARRLKYNTFKDLLNLGNKAEDQFLDDPDVINFPIDVVYTWVNGDDEVWLNKKSNFQSNVQNNRVHQGERFKSRDELRYSLRSLELYAPWVNKIYIVTDNQVPDWLDVEKASSRIKIIDHKDIMESEYLPCFNSSAIETFLHRIEGLSEHFLYFNDDFMLNNQVFPSDFFEPNGNIKCFPSNQRAEPYDINDESEEYIIADKTAIKLITGEFGSCRNEIMCHAPYPSKKSILYTLESKFKKDFEKCRSNKFRSKDDLRPIAFFQYHFGYHTREVYYSQISNSYIRLSRLDLTQRLQNLLKSKDKCICLNDAGTASIEADTAIREYLDVAFPLKLNFEL